MVDQPPKRKLKPAANGRSMPPFEKSLTPFFTKDEDKDAWQQQDQQQQEAGLRQARQRQDEDDYGS
jgi:hypothetical protein